MRASDRPTATTRTDLYDLALSVVLVVVLATSAPLGSTLWFRVPAAVLGLMVLGALASPVYRERLRGVWPYGAVLAGAVVLYFLPVVFADAFRASLQVWLVWGHRLITTWLAVCLVLPGRVVGWRLLAGGVLAWLGFHAAMGCLQWAGVVAPSHSKLLTGVTHWHTYMGLLLAAGLVLSCGVMAVSRRPWLWLPVALLFALPLPLTGARNGWVGGAIGMLVILVGHWRQWRLWTAYAVVAGAAGASLWWGVLHIGWVAHKVRFLFKADLNGREQLWTEGLSTAPEASRYVEPAGEAAGGQLMWLGHGLSLRHLSSGWLPHNVLIETYLTGGLVGLAALAGVVGMLAVRLWRRFPDPSGVSWVLLGLWGLLAWMTLFDFSVYTNQRLTLMLALLIGATSARVPGYNRTLPPTLPESPPRV